MRPLLLSAVTALALLATQALAVPVAGRPSARCRSARWRPASDGGAGRVGHQGRRHGSRCHGRQRLSFGIAGPRCQTKRQNDGHGAATLVFDPAVCGTTNRFYYIFNNPSLSRATSPSPRSRSAWPDRSGRQRPSSRPADGHRRRRRAAASMPRNRRGPGRNR